MQKNWVKMVPKQVFTWGGFKSRPPTRCQFQRPLLVGLRGVLAPEMKSILQFMYLGQAAFYQERMNEFLNVAKSLEFKELSKDVDCDDPGSSQNEVLDQDITPQIQNSYEKTTFAHTNNVKGEIEKIRTNGNGQWKEVVQYPCNDCDKNFSHKLGLYKHIKSVHEGAKYPCDECGHISTRKDHLHTQMKRRHSISQELKLQ